MVADRPRLRGPDGYPDAHRACADGGPGSEHSARGGGVTLNTEAGEPRMKTLTDEQLDALADGLYQAVNFQEVEGRLTWNCNHDHAHTIQILGDMGLSYLEIEAAVKEMSELGGNCDCEVILNIVQRERGPAVEEE